MNGAVASIAVTEFMVHISGLRQPAGHLIYRAEAPTIRRSLDPPEDDCYYCRGVWGSAVG